ncbi:tRNA (adenosine(37)-N6)-threonylcarbamoyltransferase complex dimerization subunit type 1 TsaB [Sphingobacterium sp. SGG-5]|uniref:tRNA (adenosine(37)-N6)-threonylcarbamoyltransferase complex dimerization subunit type 1 TsaB n=1 Tax=Sphingobacterium sp. SGG-5 TaxID=2710881 RepID=UPI0013EDA23A|nr:tRNA (adenosine(37)-N6)-threonylcarbamoyltransferase complex dimerization subunit type 1 TsaB [Sphingobacterium sp. SGG-5]NGM60345.1 tRNA (adenosine(37)-N6)-threonylcarbamoyltransferase complex dimerization subunit type 1 TsaB [Sphingobacterium sp. SGG-5]
MRNQYILQIDTATEVCSVSISASGGLIDTITAAEPNEHASKLTLFIDEILRRNNASFSDIVAVAVSMGPGSYTGLRIGVSTAKGICYGLNLPLIAIHTLHSMFDGYQLVQADSSYDLFCPMIDARRMEVYMSIFDKRGDVRFDTSAQIITKDSFEAYNNKKIVLFGSGANKFKELFESDPAIAIDTAYRHSSAYLTRAAWQKYIDRDFEDMIYFEPFYLKEFVATTPKKQNLA